MNSNKQKDTQSDKNNGYNNPHLSVYSNTVEDSSVKDKWQKEILKDSLEYTIKRTEKLSIAIYMITSLVSDTEPIKWTLRKKSIDLILELSGARKFYSLEQTQAFLTSINLTNEILTFLNISYSVNIISEMNFSVLRDEYTSLQNSITQNNLKETDNSLIEEILGKDERGELSSKTSSKGHNYHKDVLYGKNKGQTYSFNEVRESSFASAVSKKTLNVSKNKKNNLDRTQKIKDIIKRKKEVTIKDISSVINGCSEKTIQRELMSLVHKNIVKKIGEKRWSKYSFV